MGFYTSKDADFAKAVKDPPTKLLQTNGRRNNHLINQTEN